MELERMDLSRFSGRIAYEHLHRYAICRESLAGKRVLDLACGTGYGTALLAEAGAKVTGLDISSEAIKTAKARYQRPGVKFLIGDCYNLPFEDGSFDVIVANEMIEHVDQHDALLAEVKRVLADDGLFLVSTPNKPVYNRYKVPNVFHVSEMEIPEFHRLLSRYFDHIQLTGTRMALVSVGFELEPNAQKSNLAAARIYHGSVDSAAMPSIENSELSLRDPEYVLAACSNKQFEAAGSPSTLFYSRDDDLWLEHEKIMAWASQLHEEDEALRATVAQTRTDAEGLRDALNQSETEKSNLSARVDDLRAATQAIAELSSSQREAVDRAVSQQTEVTARLLEEVIGTPVSPEPAAIAATIMQLGQRLALASNHTADLERLTQALAESQRQTAALRDVLDGETRSKLQMKFELKEATSTQQRLAREIDDARTRTAQAENGLAEARAASAAAAATSELREQELQRLQAELDDVHAGRAAALETGELQNQEIERLKGELTEKQTRAALEEGRRAQLEEEVAQLRATVKALREQATLATQAATTAGERSLGLPNPQDFGSSEPALTVAAPTSKIASSGDLMNENRRVAMKSARHQIATSKLLSREFVAEQLAKGSLETPIKSRPSAWSALDRIRPPFKTAIFDAGWVRAQNPGSGRITLGTYLAKRSLHHLDPHPLFSVGHYLSDCGGLELDQASPLEHYVFEGWRKGLDPHPYFANDWYLAQNRDVLAHNRINPLDHYLTNGWKEGRWPNPAFDPRAYLDRYPDVRQSGMEPLTHFVAHGQAEGREPGSRVARGEWSDCLASEAPGYSLLGYLLSGDPNEGGETKDNTSNDAPDTHENSWPPQPLNDYWPPQALRDFIIDGYGEESLGLYWYLYSVMAAYHDKQSDFPESSACKRLLEQARELAAAKVMQHGTIPAASIIIPVYNNVLDTVLCIVSILATDQGSNFEIIVADDGSKDLTAQLITSIGGIVRYIRQPRNYGFLQNCNEAARQADGTAIVLLNNDTLVLPNWLDALLAPFETADKVGLVGSKLINWDGTLQEAGGIYWRDGSAWNFGRGGDPRSPEFSYLKDVDYCSGASIAVPAKLWRKVGGFDARYSPAYCEDSDLAFRLRDLGYRTLYSPASEVIHHEGRSHGRDIGSGVKAYQVKNQQQLFERWQEALERDHFPNAENVLYARDRSRHRKHVLIIDHYVIQPDRDAGSRSTMGCITAFLEMGWQVTFWPDNLYRDPNYTQALQNLGVEVIFGNKYVGNFEEFIKSRKDIYDAAFINRPHIALPYINGVRKHTAARILFYGHDLHFRRLAAARAIGENVSEEEIEAIRQTELAACSSSDVIYYPDPEEVQLVADLLPSKKQVISLPVVVFTAEVIAAGRKKAERISAPAAGRLLFVGGFSHKPNTDGILWFVHEVLPQIRDRFGTVHLTIAGSNPPAEIQLLASEGIDVTGFIPDDELERQYEVADVAIVPLRFGAGVKGKVIEAMANGVPVVTTPFGIQGIASAEKLTLIASDPEGFAAAVVECLRDREKARKRARAALTFVQQSHSTAALRRALQAGLDAGQAE
jgi:GT2 family glycosyltransferase/ubiquinone/menaquinone biosynthesis C-methylase UbiE